MSKALIAVLRSKILSRIMLQRGLHSLIPILIVLRPIKAEYLKPRS